MCHTPKTLTLQVVRECHQQRIHPNNFSKDSCGHQGLPYSGKEHTIDRSHEGREVPGRTDLSPSSPWSQFSRQHDLAKGSQVNLSSRRRHLLLPDCNPFSLIIRVSRKKILGVEVNFKFRKTVNNFWVWKWNTLILKVIFCFSETHI